MPLAPGSRIGPYEILSPIGAGGMGEVYRARDARLNREVAIKALPEHFSADPERVARFEREAQLLAAINHPNIAGIYGVEHAGAALHLVLELVPGESLAQRLEAGALPMNESLTIARQIADALECAHDKGIIHRDLKPGNVMITPEGRVKVLDFGLAKALSAETHTAAAIENSPTITSPAMTAMGMIIGTAAYMAPEQVKGRAADKRCDIWAFGCVLFELLSGTRAFAGEDVSDTLAAVLRGEPDWTALPKGTPPFMERLLRRCLARDRAQRLPDISIARYEIDEFLAGRTSAISQGPAGVRAASWTRTIAIASFALLLGIAATAAVFTFLLAPAPPPQRVVKFEIRAPANGRFMEHPVLSGTDVAISADGSRIVYRVVRQAGVELALRRLDEVESVRLPGTAGAQGMSVSPDGSAVAFQADGKLQVVSPGAPSPIVVCDVPAPIVGTRWLDSDTILYAQHDIYKVAATGGAPEVIVRADGNDASFAFPEVAPGGKAIFYTKITSALREIIVRDLASGREKIVAPNASFARTAAADRIVFLHNARLVAAAWNRRSMQIEGTPVALDEDVPVKLSGGSTFDVSPTGTFAAISGKSIPYRSRFMWRSRTGEVLKRIGSEDVDYPRYPRISHDGRRVAASIGVGSHGQIWVFDANDAAQPLKLTYSEHNVFPTWTHDDRQLIFRRLPTAATTGWGGSSVVMVPSDGSSLDPKPVMATVPGETPTVDLETSPDGAWLIFTSRNASTGKQSLMIKPLDKEGEPRQWISEPFAIRHPAFSSDGKWVAFSSTRTGTAEIWVHPFPGPGAPKRVSSNGGIEPVWARNGKELFYQEQGKLMAAPVLSTGTEITFGAPKLLFEGGFVPYSDGTPRTYDVAPDGRFLMIEDKPQQTSLAISVVIGWAGKLRK